MHVEHESRARASWLINECIVNFAGSSQHAMCSVNMYLLYKLITLQLQCMCMLFVYRYMCIKEILVAL